jgi:phosphoribosylamine--glycine ligase
MQAILRVWRDLGNGPRDALLRELARIPGVYVPSLYRHTYDGLHIATRDGFACGVVLTVPPFPYRHGYEDLSKGEPVCLRPGITPQQRAGLAWAEVAQVRGHLVTSGCTGYVGVATGIGETVAQACDAAYALARQVVVPNLRYRTDIGERVRLRDLERLSQLGWSGLTAP